MIYRGGPSLPDILVMEDLRLPREGKAEGVWGLTALQMIKVVTLTNSSHCRRRIQLLTSA